MKTRKKRNDSLTYKDICDYIKQTSECIILTTEEDFNNKLSEVKYPSKVQIEIICEECKQTHYYVNYARYKERHKSVCTPCTNKKRVAPKKETLSIEVVREKIESSSNTKLLSGSYKGGNYSIELLCECGAHFKTTFNKFMKSTIKKCKSCSRSIANQSLTSVTYEEVNDYISSKGCKLLTDKSDYINSISDLWVVGDCNHIFQMNFNLFKKRKTFDCPDCIGRTEWSIPKIKKWIKENTEGYKLKSRVYINQKKKLNIECPQGHLFKKDWVHFLRGQRCSVCESSSGEQSIEAYLINKSFNYKKQHWFKDCRHINPLPFDFGVFNKDGSLKCLIEFDGRQHYEPVDFGDITMEEAEIRFEDRKIKDQIKDEYCNKKRIKLIRIPYWDQNNVKQILSKELGDNK